MKFEKETMIQALEILPNSSNFVVKYDNNLVIESYKDGNELRIMTEKGDISINNIDLYFIEFKIKEKENINNFYDFSKMLKRAETKNDIIFLDSNRSEEPIDISDIIDFSIFNIIDINVIEVFKLVPIKNEKKLRSVLDLNELINER